MLQNLGSIFKLFLYFLPLLRKQRPLILSSLLALIAEAALQLATPWPLKFVIDHITKSHIHLMFAGIERLDSNTLIIVSAISIVVIVGLRSLAAYHRDIGFAIIGNRVMTEVRNVLYKHLQYLSLSFHTKSRSGDLILRVMSDINTIKDITILAFLPLLGGLLFLVGMIGVMFWMNWELALLAMTITPGIYLSSIRKSRQIKDLARKQRKREGTMASTATESIGSIKEVHALSLNDVFFKAFVSQSNLSLDQDVRGRKLEAGLGRMVDFLVAIATALVLWYGANLVIAKDLSAGELIVFISYLAIAFKPARDFAKYSSRLARASAAAERVMELFERKLDVDDLPNAIEAHPLRGDVTFRKVSFAYEPGQIVIDNIDFSVAAGEHVALLGPSGSGKSTLVSLILRLYDPTQGRVIIDGRDIREYTLASLRKQISVVLQDNVLFAVSARENIAYGDLNANPEEVEAAAHLANAHQFISMLPNGYDTILGERGITLSKGQRQRLAVARAAIRKAPILILDEPTTGLDEQNERMLIEAMDLLAKGRTTFLITHNLRHATRCDLILYLEAGRVVENGTHAELMKLNGRYAAMYKMQVHIDTLKERT
jgi:ATP-binding cassette subfamily B protein